jgi:hypothetical protein
VNELRPDVHPELARVIARCLEKDPAMRYASVADLARELEPWGSQRGVSLRIAQVAGSGGVPQNPRSTGKVVAAGGTSVAWEDTQLSPPPRRRTATAVFAGVGLIVLVGGGIAVGFRAGHSAAGTSAAEVTPTVRQIDLAAVAPSVPPVASAIAAPASSAAVAAPAPSAAVAPSASAAQPSPSASAVAAPKPHSHSHTPAPAKNAGVSNVKKGNDDFPDERN